MKSLLSVALVNKESLIKLRFDLVFNHWGTKRNLFNIFEEI